MNLFRTSAVWAVNDWFVHLGIPSQSVFYVDYWDPLKNDSGQADLSCLGLDSTNFPAADGVLQSIKNVIANSSALHNWTHVDGIEEKFAAVEIRKFAEKNDGIVLTCV